MAKLDLDTDALRDAVAVAKQIDENTATAKNLLNQNIQTADWNVGKLTDSLKEKTAENRTKIEKLNEKAASLFQAIEYASTRFEEVEQQNIQRQQSVDSIIASIHNVAASPVGGSVSISSFQGISESIEGKG
ncbi:MAG: hypothetical protein Q4C02_07045 [Eubacteriales bacterium]|nr:hypothetical protein [Eubacteriales bacterium]